MHVRPKRQHEQGGDDISERSTVATLDEMTSPKF